MIFGRVAVLKFAQKCNLNGMVFSQWPSNGHVFFGCLMKLIFFFPDKAVWLGFVL